MGDVGRGAAPDTGRSEDAEVLATLTRAWGWALFVVPMQFACIGFVVIVLGVGVALVADLGVVARAAGLLVAVGVWGLFVVRTHGLLGMVAGDGPGRPSPARTLAWRWGLRGAALLLPGWILWVAFVVMGLSDWDGPLTPWAAFVLLVAALLGVGAPIGALVLWRTGNGRVRRREDLATPGRPDVAGRG